MPTPAQAERTVGRRTKPDPAHHQLADRVYDKLRREPPTPKALAARTGGSITSDIALPDERKSITRGRSLSKR